MSRRLLKIYITDNLKDVEHITDLGELFEQVQLQSIFPDGKTFVDCIPRFSISDIRSRYESQEGQPGFSLLNFVHENFMLPKQPVGQYQTAAGRPIEQHIALLWNELTRTAEEKGSSLIKLPNPYVVPGGRFREMFYWDSYFTMLGLEVSGKVGLIENMVDNFSFLIKEFGYIPNGNRTYFTGRSQPPFFASMLKLLNDATTKEGSSATAQILLKYLPALEKEYAFWMRGTEQLDADHIAINRVVLMPDGSILNRYWDESDTPRPESYKEDVELAENIKDKNALFRNIRAACESGWDFSSRWFREEGEFTSIHTTEIIPVDLNCLAHDIEMTLAESYKLLKDTKASVTYQVLADKRKDAINTYCWSDKDKFYFDYDFVNGALKNDWTLAGVYPLFFKVADQDKAAHAARIVEKHFLYRGGLQSTTKITVQQWDSPNGWAPLQWIAIKGLLNYGFDDLAKEISNRWTSLNEKVYLNTGKMMEKYNVVDTDLPAGGGEYLSQDGFGWTNGVYLALKKLAG